MTHHNGFVRRLLRKKRTWCYNNTIERVKHPFQAPSVSTVTIRLYFWRLQFGYKFMNSVYIIVLSLDKCPHDTTLHNRCQRLVHWLAFSTLWRLWRRALSTQARLADRRSH